MSKVIKSALELIGNTPLLQADRYAKKAGVTDANLYVKLEYLNPSGSVKDRIALAMIEDAEEKGELKPGATIIEPTSGNTGIGIGRGNRKGLSCNPDTAGDHECRTQKSSEGIWCRACVDRRF